MFGIQEMVSNFNPYHVFPGIDNLVPKLLCPPTKERLRMGVSIKLLKNLVAQGASKLQHLKVFALLIYKGK